jgi:hypothetical protein
MDEALVAARFRVLSLQVAIEKAKGRRRMPGDGDGDGIAHESRNKKGGGFDSAKVLAALGPAPTGFFGAAARIITEGVERRSFETVSNFQGHMSGYGAEAKAAQKWAAAALKAVEPHAVDIQRNLTGAAGKPLPPRPPADWLKAVDIWAARKNPGMVRTLAKQHVNSWNRHSRMNVLAKAYADGVAAQLEGK